MAIWKLVEKNVKYIRQQPYREFIADTYQCSNCCNKANSTDLPIICPWCGELMGIQGGVE